LALNDYRNLYADVRGALGREDTPTQSRIRELIALYRKIFTLVTDIQAEELARAIEADTGIEMKLGATITNENFEPWLESARAKDEFSSFYWDRYKDMLVADLPSKSIVNTIDRKTDDLLGRLGNPELDEAWDRRGLVIGSVQSGKTANYTGLICKAADAGYRLIIVIAGIHNNLRAQTQKRIEEGFVGATNASLEKKVIGVGKVNASRRPLTFTSIDSDFHKGRVDTGVNLEALKEPVILVIKKNPNTLRNVIGWLRNENAERGSKKINAPMLLLDDEADNASINIKSRSDEISTINGLLRDLLSLFERSCYVGYTATPFANIFIEPDSDDDMKGEDLFPRHFISTLDPPTNYFGPNKVFLQSHAPEIVLEITDNEDVLPIKHKKEHVVFALPKSMKEAVRAFVVARAIRIRRGDENEHCSMLINASRFTSVQSQLQNEVFGYLKDLQSSIKLHSKLPVKEALKNEMIFALHKTWKKHYENTELGWSQIQTKLHQSAAKIRVEEINSKSDGKLNYEEYPDGCSVIAIGGFSLSRGLTLEGLIVSYYLRNSAMYDTLMQMGRWFGYRTGYEDLCRIWMPEQAREWYSHIAESIESLRQEVKDMESQGRTPEEFGLKVRSHEDTLMVTARNKLGSGEKQVVKLTLGNTFRETYALDRSSKAISQNWQVFEKLIRDLSQQNDYLQPSIHFRGSFLQKNVPGQFIEDFIESFHPHKEYFKTDPELLLPYIRERSDTELAYWDVLIFGRQKNACGEKPILGNTINLQERSVGDKSNEKDLFLGNKFNVATRGVEKAGLSVEEIEEAEKKYRIGEYGSHADAKRKLHYPGHIYRAIRKRPLLVIHLIQAKDRRKGKEFDEEVVAYSISFPKTSKEEKREEFIVNSTWMAEMFGVDANEEDLENE